MTKEVIIKEIERKLSDKRKSPWAKEISNVIT